MQAGNPYVSLGSKLVENPGASITPCTRATIETYLDLLVERGYGPASRGYDLSSIRSFLRAVRQQEWEPLLAVSADVFPGDHPRRPQPAPTSLPAFVMAQIEPAGSVLVLLQPQDVPRSVRPDRRRTRRRAWPAVPVHRAPVGHTYGTRLINSDVPQEVVRRLLDHESAEMTARYARLRDDTIRRHWEHARKVNIAGETIILEAGTNQ